MLYIFIVKIASIKKKIKLNKRIFQVKSKGISTII